MYCPHKSYTYDKFFMFVFYNSPCVVHTPLYEKKSVYWYNKIDTKKCISLQWQVVSGCLLHVEVRLYFFTIN